jgi:hypothetical protein
MEPLGDQDLVAGLGWSELTERSWDELRGGLTSSALRPHPRCSRAERAPHPGLHDADARRVAPPAWRFRSSTMTASSSTRTCWATRAT